MHIPLCGSPEGFNPSGGGSGAEPPAFLPASPPPSLGSVTITSTLSGFSRTRLTALTPARFSERTVSSSAFTNMRWSRQ